MTDHGRSTLRGVAFALTAFGLYATHDVVIKFLGGIYSPFQIIFYSVLLSFPLVMLVLMRDQTQATLIPVHPWWTAIRTVATLINGSTAFYAFSTIPLAQTYAILFATPLLITVLSVPILGERVGIHRSSAVVVGLIGVLVVLRPGAADLTLGHLAAITAAVGSSFASIIVRKIGRDERSAVLMLYPMMANFFVMAALMPVFYQPMPVEHLGLVGIIAVFGLIAGFLMIRAYRSADAAIVAPMQYSQILWAAGYGAFFFDEVPDLYTWVGAGIIILSGIYIVMRESLGGRSSTTPVRETRTRAETGISPRISTLLRLRGGQH